MWQFPKTDWQPNDLFNIQDYNRIKGNLEEIRNTALELYTTISFEEMGADKSYQDYSFYADELNRFEDNLEHICSGTYPFAIGNRTRVYADNTPFIMADELNRIESACLMIYQNLKSGADGRQQLEFTLNGGDL